MAACHIRRIMTVWLELAIVVGLTLLNGFFAMAELAIVSSRRIRLQQMAEAGNRGAARALTLAENPGRFLSGVQVGITLIGIMSGAYGGATLGARLGTILNEYPIFAPRGEEIAFILVVIMITALSVVVGELVPKRIALLQPERIAAAVARPVQILVLIARPLVWFLETSTALLLKLLRIPEKKTGSVTEEEVKLRHRRRHRSRRHRRSRRAHDPWRACAGGFVGRLDHGAAPGCLLDRSGRRDENHRARNCRLSLFPHRGGARWRSRTPARRHPEERSRGRSGGRTRYPRRRAADPAGFRAGNHAGAAAAGNLQGLACPYRFHCRRIWRLPWHRDVERRAGGHRR